MYNLITHRPYALGNHCKDTKSFEKLFAFEKNIDFTKGDSEKQWGGEIPLMNPMGQISPKLLHGEWISVVCCE